MRTKRILASLLVLMMLFTLMPAFALAEAEEEEIEPVLVEEETPEPEAEEPEAIPEPEDEIEDEPVAYDLWVCGEQVTDANKNKIAGSFGLRFDPATSTLTIAGNVGSALNNPANLTNGAVIYSELPELTITTGVDFTFTSDTAEKLIYVNGGNLTLKKTSTNRLILSSPSANYGIYVSGGNLTIDCHLDLTAPAAEYGICVESGDLVLDNILNKVPVVFLHEMKNGVGIFNGKVSGSTSASSSTILNDSGNKEQFSAPTLYGVGVEEAVVVTDGDLNLAGRLTIRSATAVYGAYAPNGKVNSDCDLRVSLSGDAGDAAVFCQTGFTASGKLVVDAGGNNGFAVKSMNGPVNITCETANISGVETGIYCGSGDVTIPGSVSLYSHSVSVYGLCPASGIYAADGSVTVGTVDFFGGASYVIYANGPVHVTGDVVIGNTGALLGGNGIKSTRGIVIEGDATIEAINCLISEGEDGICIKGNATLTANGNYGINATNGPVTFVTGKWDVTAGTAAIQAKEGILIPAGYGVTLPEGGKVAQVDDFYTVTKADGVTVAKHAIIEEKEEETITVSFDAGEGAVDPATKDITAGAAIGELPTPTREGGWVFMGWYMAPAATAFDICQGTEVTAATTFTENTKVYAHWRLPGDVNGDGNVDGTDVTLLATYVKAGGLNVRIVPYSGDVSGDENVDGTDVTLLATFVKANGLNVVIH